MAKAKSDKFAVTMYEKGIMTIEHRIHVTSQTLLAVCHNMLKHVEGMQVKALYVYQTEAFFKKAGLKNDYKLIEAIIAVIIGVFTNDWSPYAPIIILFCALMIQIVKFY